MILPMFTIERRKLFKQNIFWLALATLCVFILAIYGIIFVVQAAPLPDMPADANYQLTSFLTWPEALINAVGFASGNGLGGLLIIALTSVVVAREYTQKTYQVWLGNGVPRWSLLLAKFAVLALATLLIVLVPVLIGFLISGIITLILQGTLPLDMIHYGQLAMSILRTAFTLLPYVSLAILLSVLSRSIVVSMGAGLAYALLIEGIFSQLIGLLGGLPAKLVRFAPNMLAASITNLNSAISRETLPVKPGIALDLLEPGTAAFFIAFYTLIMLGFALTIFQRQDINI